MQWHHASETKYKGEGWMDIARAELKQQKDKNGNPVAYKDKDVTNLAQKIRSSVKALRQNRRVETK